jgi:alkanesulfonate monooxygenase SsuD/methylene tetrahydromethanopterin reductase-like flavin-dependent oxidoreductase (luciferase family)
LIGESEREIETIFRRGRMSERLETLKKARDRMIEDRDAHAKVLAAPFVRDTAERARNKFIEIQALIDALDRAIRGEMPVPVKN